MILGKDPPHIDCRKEYSINFTMQQNEFSLSLNYNGLHSYIFVLGVAIDKLKEKDSEIYAAVLFLGNT